MQTAETVRVQMPDGSTVPVRIFPATATHHTRKAVLILPGLGMSGGYYDLLARDLSARGVDAVVGGMRSNGSSGSYGYHEVVSVDVPAMTSVLRERFPDSTPFLLGHSLGGQLGALYAARARNKVGGLILVASGTPYFRAYGPAISVGLLATRVLGVRVPGVAPMAGWRNLPHKIGNDWGRLARTGRFEPTGADIDYEARLAALRIPVLAITIEGDTIAPVASARHLIGKLDSAEVTRWHQPERLGHNGWIRNPTSTVDRIQSWLSDR